MKDDEFTTFLNMCRTDNKISHVAMGEFNARMSIPRCHIEVFWKLYCDRVEAGEIMGIAEFPRDVTAFVIDWDIKGKSDKVKCLYRKNRIPDLVEIVQKILMKTVAGITEDDMLCVFMDKTPYKKANDVSCGIHMHFPNLFLDSVKIQHYIYPKIKEAVKNSDVFEPLNFTENVTLDAGVVKTTWMMYNSMKKGATEPYRVSTYYYSGASEISAKKAFKDYKLYNTDEELIDLSKNPTYYLPRILSVFPFGRQEKQVIRDADAVYKEEMMSAIRSQKTITFDERDDEEVVRNIEDAKKFMPLLSQSRSEAYDEWRQIGAVLYNIGKGGKEAFEMWDEFSQRTSVDGQYDQEKLMDSWEKMKENNYTLGSLRHYAREDSPEEYSKLVTVDRNKVTNDCLSGTHTSLAKLLHVDYRDKFKCSDITSNEWFEFKGHTWNYVQSGFSVRNIMSEELPKRFKELEKKLYSDRANTMDADDQKQIDNRLMLVKKTIANLEMRPFKKNVMDECKDIFYDEKFHEKLDSDPMLIGFNNGIYDLTLHKLRDGKPEDYICRKIDFDYQNFSDSDMEVIEIHEFLEKLFPDPELKTYFLDTTCEIFEGFNKQKIIQLWVGPSGCNGKSILMNLMTMALGKYSVKIPTAFITGKKTPSGSACPELARTGHGVRLVTFQEPSRKDEANSGTLKELSGNDPFYTRDLFKSGGEINPMFKMIIVCNHAPKMDAEDPALWNRLRVLPFEARFPKTGVPATYEEQVKQKIFVRDPTLQTKLYKLVLPFIWVLTDHYRKLQTDPSGFRIEPEKVMAATEKYKKENDVFLQYLVENIVPDKKSSLGIKAIFEHYKDWFKSSYPGIGICSKMEIQEYLTRRWDAPLPGIRWQGWRFRDTNDDLKEEKAFVIKLKSKNSDDAEAENEDCDDAPDEGDDAPDEEGDVEEDTEEVPEENWSDEE
jgi:P4 family phage/plasmid primase-like protien